MGFAPPLHSGFAFIANAHGDELGCRQIPGACYECTIRFYRSRVCVPQHKPHPKFAECFTCELRRAPIPLSS